MHFLCGGNISKQEPVHSRVLLASVTHLNIVDTSPSVSVFQSKSFSICFQCSNLQKYSRTNRTSLWNRNDKHTSGSFCSFSVYNCNHRSTEAVAFLHPLVFLSVLLSISLFISPPSSWWTFTQAKLKASSAPLNWGNNFTAHYSCHI